MVHHLTPIHRGDYSEEFFMASRGRQVLAEIHAQPQSKRTLFARQRYATLEKKWGKDEVEQLKDDIRAELKRRQGEIRLI